MRCESPPREAAYTVPERSGEVLIVPPPACIPDLLAAARRETWEDADVLGTPLAAFRRRARQRALALAARYTGAEPPSPDRPLIVMGHQPVFFHPGVWVKYFLLTRLCAAHGATGLHLIVDTDAPGPVGADVPTGRTRLDRVRETLLDLPEDVPLEAASLPAPEAWAAWTDRLRDHLASLSSPGPARCLEAFASGEPVARRGARTLGEFLGRLRRAYEARAGAPRYLELPVSALADTPEFREFALHLLRSPDETLRVYNASLEAYRRAHRVRSAANPFPNLSQGCGRIEAPFWVLRGARRTELFVAREDDRLVLASQAEPLATVPAGAAGAGALAQAGVSLRPKAMALTLFARLCLGDLFIHGVGGGRYDRVTDAISEGVFGCRPAPYLVTTATLHLALPEEARAAGERPALEQRLMELRHNPDRHLTDLSEAQRRLVGEKWALIRELDGMRPGPARRAAARRIREINRELAAPLAPEIARIETTLAALRGQKDVEDVVRYREYPFFLFDPPAVAALAAAPGDGTAPRGG